MQGAGAAGGPVVADHLGRKGFERMLRALMFGSGHLAALIEADGTIAYVSRSVERLLGYQQTLLLGRDISSYIHPDDLDMAASMLAAARENPRSGPEPGADEDISGEYRLRHADGHWIPFEFTRSDLLADPDVAGVLVLGRPVVARHSLEQALGVLAFDSEGNDTLRHLLDYLEVRLPGTCSAVIIAGDNPEWIGKPGTVTLRSSHGPWERAMDDSDLVTASVDDVTTLDPLLSRAASAAGFKACWCLPLPVRRPRMYVYRQMARRDDHILGCLVVWSAKDVNVPAGYLGVLERVAGLAHVALEHRAERQRLLRLVDYDQVTGALSRAGMRSMVEGRETVSRVHMLFDLDDFKIINDRYGHSAGDKILRQAVERIMSVLRYQDLLVRLGGDEFLILLAGGDIESGIAVSGRVMAALEEPIEVGAGNISVRTSIGIAPFDRNATFDELTDRADRAMYAAKQKGKSRFEVWTPGLIGV